MITKLTKINLLFITLFVALVMAKPLCAQVHEDTLSILFVGNSYTYGENLPHLVSYLSEGTPIKLLTRKSTIGGAKLSEHWHEKRGLKSRELIEDGDFDIVVLQNHSMSAMERPDSLLNYVGLFCDLTREADARPYLYVTWAREKVPQFQEEINQVYLKAAKEHDATPVMVGDAWVLAKAYRPGIDLYTSDGSHASELGAYLTACMFVKTICGQLPDMMPGPIGIKDAEGESITLMFVNPMDGVFMKKVVEELTSPE